MESIEGRLNYFNLRCHVKYLKKYVHDVYEWLGFPLKMIAVRRLKRAGYIEGEDYIIEANGTRQRFILSVNCMRQFCMLGRSDVGREYRLYLITKEQAMFQRLEQELLALRAANMAIRSTFPLQVDS
jgi:phage anti-repressor protein